MSKTTPVNYYNAEDVMKLTGYGICKCRKLIKSLNDELKALGYLVIAGKVPKKYYHTRYGFTDGVVHNHGRGGRV